MLFWLGNLINDAACLKDEYHYEYVLNRIKFNRIGLLSMKKEDDLTVIRQQMMLVVYLLLRIAINNIFLNEFKLKEMFPKTEIKESI